MLLLGAMILTLGVVRLGVTEQRIANTELRAAEAQQAAQAGLDYALAWLGRNQWRPDRALPTPPMIPGSGDHLYRTRLEVIEQSDCLRVSAWANADSDSDIRALASECVRQSSLLGQAFKLEAPPLVIAGCLSGVTGAPRIDARRCDDPAADPSCQDIAIWSSASMDCLDISRFDLSSHQVRAGAFTGTAWEALFTIDKDDFRRLATEQPTTFRWISSMSELEGTLGSATSPVVVAIDRSLGCPSFSGHHTLYGILYVEHDGGCDLRGWGATTIYGTAVFESAVDGINANTRLRHWTLAGEADAWEGIDPVRSAQRIPGSWRDWAREP
jgi:hypothetical protein